MIKSASHWKTGSRFMLGTIVLISACGSDGLERTVASRFWTKTGEESCSKMDGKVYCFPKKYIEANSFDTDAATGYLFFVPITDPDLVECNKKKVQYKYRYPFVQLSVSEIRSGDTFLEKYRRAKEMMVGTSSKDIAKPEVRYSYLGMNCVRYKKESALHEEMMCHGGDVLSKNTAFFFGCMWDGSVPNARCNETLYRDGLEYRVSYNKTCKPYVMKIRQYMLDFVESGRLLGGM